MKKKTKKNKKTKMEILRRRELILNGLCWFGFISTFIFLIIGCILETKGIIEDSSGILIILIYAFVIIIIVFFLSIKWGATKGGYSTEYGTFGFNTDLIPKTGGLKEAKPIINSYNDLLKYFDSSKYKRENMKFKNYKIKLYSKNVYSCINSYLIIEGAENLSNDLKDIRDKCLNTLVETNKKSCPMSYNLMIIVYIGDDKKYKEYEKFMSKLDMLEVDVCDELVIPAMVRNNKLQCLDYIKGPMWDNYNLCINEIDKIVK